MNDGFNRRQALAAFGSVSLGALLAACGSDGDSTTDVSATDGEGYLGVISLDVRPA